MVEGRRYDPLQDGSRFVVSSKILGDEMFIHRVYGL
jgi:hypothetical protein